MRSRYISNKIMAYLQDYEKHTLNEIACEIEVSKYTVMRHIRDLSLDMKIVTFFGRYSGGVQLLPPDGSEEVFTNKEIDIIEKALEQNIENTSEAIRIINKIKAYRFKLKKQ